MSDDDLYTRLGRRLRARRRLLNLTQGDVARACGTRFQQIQKYESGATLSVARLLRISTALEISPAELLAGIDPLPAGSERRDGDHRDPPAPNR